MSIEIWKKFKNWIEMVTLHSSKGLEYEIVFIIDVIEGVIPHQKAVLEERSSSNFRIRSNIQCFS